MKIDAFVSKIDIFICAVYYYFRPPSINLVESDVILNINLNENRKIFILPAFKLACNCYSISN